MFLNKNKSKHENKGKQGSTKSTNKGRAINIALLIVIFSILGFCGYNINKEFSKYWNAYEKSIETKNEASRQEKSVDWNKLKSTNPDTIGWIYCEDTIIDYPIVKSKNNSEYLTRGFDGSFNYSGTLFADNTTVNPFNDFNTTIYGHHMRDGSMFAVLDNWLQQDYFDKHPYIYIYTPEQNYKIKVLYAAHVKATNENIYKLPIETPTEKEKFLSAVKSSAITGNKNEDLSTSSNYVTLSTCAYVYHDARTIVVGKIIPVNKPVYEIEKHKDIKKDSKFKVFRKMMKEIFKEQWNDIKNKF